MIEKDVVRTRARTLPSIVLAILAVVRRGLAWTKEWVGVIVKWTKNALTGPVKATIVGPVKTFLLGRQDAVSIAIVGLSIVVAPAITWWVAITTGYPPIERLVTETWTGTNPHGIVFASAALLVGLGIVSAAMNSGVVPTTLLVMAPLFGVAVTRYGTQYVDPVLGTRVVSLPEAIEFATTVAVVGGVPLALGGFVLGELLRRAIQTLGITPRIAPGRNDS